MSKKPNADMAIHPDAAVFPMMTDDELADLAADIKANGLIHPIVRDADGVLIDGRNRLRACELAGVEPTFAQLNGHDAKAFIVGANLNRRNMKKGQQAMALAMIYPDTEKRGRGNKSESLKHAKSAGFSSRVVQDARSVLRHSRALADNVLADRVSMSVALKQVEAERQASASTDAKMERLRKLAPDVAAMVDDDRLTLAAAGVELGLRQQRVRQCVDAATQSLRHFLNLSAHLTVVKNAFALTDEDLALIDASREDIDLFAGVTDVELSALDGVSVELREMVEGEGL